MEWAGIVHGSAIGAMLICRGFAESTESGLQAQVPLWIFELTSVGTLIFLYLDSLWLGQGGLAQLSSSKCDQRTMQYEVKS